MKNSILIINHNIEAAQEMKDNMTTPNADVICVTSMKEALQIYMRKEFCLIILDAQISAEDDHQLLSAIRKSKTTPILILLPLSRRLGSRAIKLLVEELAVDPAGNRDAAGFRQFLVHLPDELIGVGYGHPQLLGHFIDAHKNLVCHDKYLPFLVVGDCCLQVLCFINASLLMSATFSRFRNQKSDGPFDVPCYLSLFA